jgi:hypothetical protein
MIKPPSKQEWVFAEFPSERRSYLELDPSFEDIAQRVADEAVCEFAEPDRLCKTAVWASEGTWRAWFKIRVHSSTSDLSYNGRDGLRGRYWQDPAAGVLATHHVLSLLEERLLDYVRTHPECIVSEPTASERSIERSLDAGSAKIWAHEKKDQNFNEGPRLFVERWSVSRPGGNWCWAPTHPLLDIKGAFFTPDHHEHIVKPHRDYEIHKYGFT